ncbi:PREDICTED: ubiquitin-like-conjugating enzyme ATG10 isoform X2 [Nanorana parkeri]|uniref:ubiquitin-like-conjugating enzyme ATG10 isoform X2 n=1 Tax=Nanorana parkeri TaxID=125878 RepID=UPI0008547550|nr:PREDICTED: ubiquitin-like-conjugating enzyme ATG10 isoform X2 [Nanorana parkeri]
MDLENKDNIVLGEEKFRYFCLEFVKHSQSVEDGWEWKNVQGSDDGYLRKSCYQTRPVSSEQKQWKKSDEEDEQASAVTVDGFHEEEDESLVIAQEAQETEVIHYEYHVLYAISYQVPVLYFRASFLDGRPLTLEEIWNRVQGCYKPRLLHGPWETITQQEHPILGQPFFMLHPCRTNEFMSSIKGASKRVAIHVVH